MINAPVIVHGGFIEQYEYPRRRIVIIPQRHRALLPLGSVLRKPNQLDHYYFLYVLRKRGEIFKREIKQTNWAEKASTNMPRHFDGTSYLVRVVLKQQVVVSNVAHRTGLPVIALSTMPA